MSQQTVFNHKRTNTDACSPENLNEDSFTIAPPFGYQALHALNRDDFVRMHHVGEVPIFAATNEILPLTYSEFFAASADYPILFIKIKGGEDLIPVVLVGLERGISLYAQFDGSMWRWDTHHYLPAYVRRHPFCMSTVNGQSGPDDELLVCVDKSYVSRHPVNQYVQLFHGEAPSERWLAIERFLQAYQTDILATSAFTLELNELGLLKPIAGNYLPEGFETPIALDGILGVDEESLNALDDTVLADLHRKGHLSHIHAHHQSLHNFSKLLGRLEKLRVAATSKQTCLNA